MNRSIAFKVPYASGCAVSEGVCWVEDDGLMLEFRARDALVGAFKGEVKELKLAWAELRQVEHLALAFRARLRIRTKRMSAISELPGSEGAEVVLRCKGRDRAALEELSHEVQKRMAAAELLGGGEA